MMSYDQLMEILDSMKLVPGEIHHTYDRVKGPIRLVKLEVEVPTILYSDFKELFDEPG
jgi:hypothetical protein